MKTTKLISIIACLAVIVSFSGCAILGSDVRGLRDIKEAHAKVFDKDIAQCYDLTLKALSKWKASVFQERKRDYIVAMEFESVFNSCINTMELGIFFTETAPHRTEVKVTSLSSNLSGFIAPSLFAYIEKDGNVPVEEALMPVAPRNARFKA